MNRNADESNEIDDECVSLSMNEVFTLLARPIKS